MPFRVPNVAIVTVGITLLFKFRIAVRIRTVSGGNDFGFFGRWTFGTDNEQDTLKPLPAFVCRCCLNNCAGIFLFFHRFLAPERHSCQKVGVTKRLLLQCCGLALFWRSTCFLETGLSKMQKVESEDLYTYNYFTALLNT